MPVPAVPRIAITTGEPAGIGPDLTVQIAQHSFDADLIAVGDPDLLQGRAAQLGLPLELVVDLPHEARNRHQPGRLRVAAVSTALPVRSGKLETGNAGYVLETLDVACDGCLGGRFDAMVTAPVHKAVINEAGMPFTGHTEYLAERSGGHPPVMMLAIPGLRVALATTHLALKDVPGALGREGLATTLQTVHRDLQRLFRIASPRIAVCGLNPHAGESGHLGREELDLIGPVLEELRQRGLMVSGPLPADTVFTPAQRERYDVIVAMYHDQGLAALKALGFGEAVNITLGLPVIRTSVDHGTALELAGSGHADPGSLLAAIQTAIDLVGAAASSSAG